MNKKIILLLAIFGIGAISAAAYQINASTASDDVSKTSSKVTVQAQDDKEEAEVAAAVSAKTSAVITKQVVKDNDDDNREIEEEDEKIVGTASISEAQAKETALRTYKGNGKLTETELEMEDGVLVYGFEFTEKDGNEVDVKIDAHTGTVVKVESDEDEESDDE